MALPFAIDLAKVSPEVLTQLFGGASAGERAAAGLQDEAFRKVRCSSPDPSRYHDPDTQGFENDSRTLSAIAGVRFGLKGTIIPRATPFGGSRGFDPHRPAQHPVTLVDVTGETPAVTIDLARASPAVLQTAAAFVEEAAGPTTDIATRKSKGIAAFHVARQLLEQEDAAARASAAPAAEPPPPVAAPAPPPAGTVTSFAAPPARLLERFTAGPAAAAAGPPVLGAEPRPLATFATAAPAAAAVPHPTRQVVFDIPGNAVFREGTVAYYHTAEVQRRPNGQAYGIVLGVDERYPGTPLFPAASEVQFALVIVGEPQVYLVESTGWVLTHKGERLCLIHVVDERPLPA